MAKGATDAAGTEQLLRIIQSIPSPKAEPFKLWLAQVGRERIEETIDPELTIERALETYLRKGYSREWINQRLQAIQVRRELTDEWQTRGVKKGVEYAILTDEITRAWSGMNTRQYKRFKGLKKENLRDNMSTTEIVLNMLAEASAKDISQAEAPETFAGKPAGRPQGRRGRGHCAAGAGSAYRQTRHYPAKRAGLSPPDRRCHGRNGGFAGDGEAARMTVRLPRPMRSCRKKPNARSSPLKVCFFLCR